MTDKELLELAAKAVDYKSYTYTVVPIENHPFYYDENKGLMILQEEAGNYYYKYWNPLNNDSDALQLAVKLYMFDTQRFFDLRLMITRNDPSKDDYEITRKAITCRAAEIGKALDD